MSESGTGLWPVVPAVVLTLAGCVPGAPGDFASAERPGPQDDHACFAARGLPDRDIDDDVSAPTISRAVTDGGIPYAEARGLFEGTTDRGGFRVPYLLTIPDGPRSRPGPLESVILFEPPHVFRNLDGLDVYFGQDFLLSRAAAHAGVGWALGSENELDRACFDPVLPDDERCFIDAGSDPQIVTEFAVAALVDPDLDELMDGRTCRYATGFSNSTFPFIVLIPLGYADGVFDLIVPITTGGTSANDIGWQEAVALGVYTGKLVIVNSESEERVVPPDRLHDDGTAGHGYRYYASAGTPHIPDNFEPGFIAARTTPASYFEELRARFLQAHDWVQSGEEPPRSTLLRRTSTGALALDDRGNAIVEDVRGRLLPRLPYVRLGEAHFVARAPVLTLTGMVEDVGSVADLGFEDHAEYLAAFREAAHDYAESTGATDEDVGAMIRRASCAPRTFTELYVQDYATFAQGGCDPR